MYLFLAASGMILRGFDVSPNVFRAIARWDNSFYATCAGDFDRSLIKNNWHLLLPTKHTTVYKDSWITIMAKIVPWRSITRVISDGIDVLSSWT